MRSNSNNEVRTQKLKDTWEAEVQLSRPADSLQDLGKCERWKEDTGPSEPDPGSWGKGLARLCHCNRV